MNTSKINLAVVPVAGLGTRMLPATKSQPKEMLPVGRKPVVQYIVDELTRNGIDRVLFITGAGKDAIENHFDIDAELIQILRETGKEDLLAELEFERSPTQYFFTRQRQLLGLGHAVLCAEAMVGTQPFVVALGDSIIGKHANSDVITRMTNLFAEHNADAVIAFETVPMSDVQNYGVAKPAANQSHDDVFMLADVIEKPNRAEAPSNLAIAARYVFSPAIFAELRRTKPGKGGEIQLTDAIRALIHSGKTVLGVRLGKGEHRYDIGNFESYFRAFVEFALSDEKHGDALREYIKTII
jgi:UTP--glucose-1-phosphate uridylyltransferase